MAKILIIGCGAIGTELARVLTRLGHTVTGVKRNPPSSDETIRYVRADIASVTDLERLPTDFDYLFFIVSVDGRTEQSYRAVYDIGLKNVLAKFATVPCIFVSSTSVYRQSNGEWVDENSMAQPDNSNSQLIRQAEQQLIALNPHNIVVRFSGIYGRGRNYLLNRAKQSPAIQHTPPYFTNRIHQDDCVHVLVFLLEKKLAGVVLANYYLASDDDPAPTYEVMTWLAQQLNCPAPSIKPIASDDMMNKRCSNQRLKALGYQFIYPSYKDGYSYELLNATLR
jgi:nucleoside-diphosphate-sugar epimerase